MNAPYVFLNSNSQERPSWYAWEAEKELIIYPGEEDVLSRIQAFIDESGDWIFGCIGYGLKDHVESLHSSHTDPTASPLVHLFVPAQVVQTNCKDIAQVKGNHPLPRHISHEIPSEARVNLKARTSKSRYLEAVESLLHHIHRGDIYEVNYCVGFEAEARLSDPLAAYYRLNALTEAPFSAYAHLGDIHLLCASPERFLKREGTHLSSQPIKGTIRRGASPEEDERLKNELFHNPKERSENTMIVDLVRNDLSRAATRGSVRVDELFGIHTFKTVHQMISTVSCEIDPSTPFTELVKNTFPMGSMTGAPKVRAMELIDTWEDQSRGIYSGCLGYITPAGDFDFNVIIRSVVYNQRSQYISAMAGSAITAQSDPEQEYEECLLKARALIQALQ